jgi:TRAP-type C4-dicarboxylate transport system substrate-binding protein
VRFVATALALLTLAVTSATARAQPAVAEPTVIRMAAIAPEGTGWARELKAMARDVENATSGKVIVKWYLGGIAGDEMMALDRIRRGQLDGAAGALFCGSLSPTLRMTRLIGLVQNRDEALHLLNYLRARIDEDFKKHGFVSLVIGNFGNDIIFLRDRVDTFGDLRKRPIWIWNAETVLHKQMQLMGLTMVPGAIDELSNLYDEQKIDGMFVIPTAALAFQWTTRARYWVDLRGSMLAGCLTLSQKTYDALDVSEQQAFAAATAKFAGRFEDLGRREDGLLFGGMLEKQGVKRLAASEALRAAFLDAAATARGQLDEQTIPKSLIKEAIDTIAAYRAAHRPKR